MNGPIGLPIRNLPKPRISPALLLEQASDAAINNPFIKSLSSVVIPSSTLDPMYFQSCNGALPPTSNLKKAGHECSQCHKSFRTEQGLQQHIGKVHKSEANSEECQTCGKRFKHKYALRYHILQVHEDATRVCCILCGQEKYNQYWMGKHFTLKHQSYLIALRRQIR